ncbi:MAG TPA: response regulator transcription factor [Oculatellaceae cyanobacterium]
MAKIFMAEDEAKLTIVIKDLLLMENHHVDSAANGGDALNQLLTGGYDLAILDWNLPELSGLEILHTIRSRGSSMPVLMLTGKSGIDDKEAGFGAGADDYLTKPFEGRELIARVKALLRRSHVAVDDVLKFGGLSLDRTQYLVTLNGEEIALVPKEFDLLEFFMRSPNRVFSPETLLSRVWQNESDATVAAVTTCIKRLRKKVDRDEAKSFIATVHGVGYKLVAPQLNR